MWFAVFVVFDLLFSGLLLGTVVLTVSLVAVLRLVMVVAEGP